MASSEYLIYRPHKLRLSDVFRLLVSRRSSKGSELVERSIIETEINYLRANWKSIFTLMLQRILIWLAVPMAFLGYITEFMLNFFSLNGGIFGLLIRIVKGSMVIPDRKSADFRSVMAHIDGRIELYRRSSSLNCDITYLELCLMAAKITYENEAYVENVVNNHWKMHLVGYYNFWNEFLGKDETQAFIFCDRKDDVQLIVVAFRGTELYNTIDWCTDIDLSWFSMGKMGKVHLGFMKALGLQDYKDYQKGWPKDYTGPHKLAYHSIRDELKTLIQDNKDAKIVVTGHSLGGALSILFPSILILHQEDEIISRLSGVYTFGQPRVGDEDFGSFMKAHLDGIYYRIVYRYDVITRIPFDDSLFQFSHFGSCIYYDGWYKGEVLQEEPDRNFFGLQYILSMYFNAWLDFVRALFITMTQGKEYKESCVSIILRVCGLISPGFASHSTRDYLNSIRLGTIVMDEDDASYES